MKRDSLIECPGCHVRLADRHHDPPEWINASGECYQAFSDLQCYSVAKQDPGFIHQHVVDSYEAQHAGGPTRPITVAFGLIGLYLALEKGYTGKQVQQAHMKIARIRKDWPRLDPPDKTAALTVIDVLQAASDEEREALIEDWMKEVWRCWADCHDWVRVTTDGLLRPSKKSQGEFLKIRDLNLIYQTRKY